MIENEQEILLKLKNLSKKQCEKLAAFVYPTETWVFFKDITDLQAHSLKMVKQKGKQKSKLYFSCHINYGNVYPIKSFKVRVKIFVATSKHSDDFGLKFKEPIYFQGNESDLIEFIKSL